jgi:hypothetical protein
MSLGFQLKHKATCRGGGCLTRHSHYVRVRLGGVTIWRVVYLQAADNASGPLATRLRRAHQPVLSTRNMFSTPRPSLLASI